MIMTEDMQRAVDYFEKMWPKGNKQRGDAMVLLALAEIGGRAQQKAIDGVKE